MNKNKDSFRILAAFPTKLQAATFHFQFSFFLQFSILDSKLLKKCQFYIFEAKKKLNRKWINVACKFVLNVASILKMSLFFLLPRTVDHFCSFKREKYTFHRRCNKSSDNVIRVRVFAPFAPIVGGFTVLLPLYYFGTWSANT